MESGVAGYLHKKFKKQSTIDYKIFKCDIENGKKEQCHTAEEEPRIGYEVRNRSGGAVPDRIAADNNAKESDESTNQNSVLNFSYCNNNATSSISVKSNTQSTGPCISYIETFRTDDRYSPRTDRAYYDRFAAPESSVATAAYSKDACSPHKEDISYNNDTSRFISNDETSVPLSTTDLKGHDGSLKSGDSNNSKCEETLPALQDKPTGGKYVCTYCNLGCSKPSVLQKHIRAHTNERPYPCISCGFSFKTRSNLYKHCRSRTHANRVMGNKVQEIGNDEKNSDHKFSNNSSSKSETEELAQDLKMKPYKPRFHNAKEIAVGPVDPAMDRHDESSLDELNNTDSLSHHINEIISKNNSIVHSNNHFAPKLLYADEYQADYVNSDKRYDEPLNLTNKNRKRCVSEVQEPITQKSLIKELLLKNLYAETMQCRYCKMIFQTVTELELHKLRSCKGFTKPGLKYTRSSSVNVASILTQNKNAFDDIPHLQNSTFPLKSPGPFLGNIRLVDREKTKSFSYEDVQADTFSAQSSPGHVADRYLWSLDLQTERDRKPTVKLFGGEVKIANTSSEGYKMDSKVHETFNPSSSSSSNSKVLIEDKLSKNHVVKSGLQSGGTVLTNKTHYSKQDPGDGEGMNIYNATSSTVASEPCDGIDRNFSFNPTSSSRDITPTITIQVPYEMPNKNVDPTPPSYSCLNIVDFSQKALKMLTPNIKRPNLNIINASKPVYDDLSHNSSHYKSLDPIHKQNDGFVYENRVKKHNNTFDPMHLVVNGRVVRYVPGMPGPVIADEPVASESYPLLDKPKEREPSLPVVQSQTGPVKEDGIKNFHPPINFNKPEIETKIDASKSLASVSMNQMDQTRVPQTKFARPNSLALKPSSVSLKQHHGLTPTMFNQILISPDTPRVAKKYVQQFLHGNYFSYLGLKSTTKPVYCTLNKTQPFYTPHFKKLSMYSEWRQQDNKTDKLFVSSYDSRQRQQRYSMAGKVQDLIVHSSYKFILTEVVSSKQEKCDDKLNSNSTTATCGYESKDDYTYIRGRGRGRYVCDQCGIRCKKPSMLKKHIKTHSDDRPYTCSHCNFSFKTKGNLTKHMKSKVHTKNSTSGSGNSSSSQQNLTQSSESESEDSDAESSDESTRQQEHEAAYGLLTLAQKTTTGLVPEPQANPVVSNLVDSGPIHSIPDMLNIMDTEEIVHVTKINYAKNKILDQQNNYSFSSHKNLLDNEAKYAPRSADETSIARPLTYPYTSVSFSEEIAKCAPAICPVISSAAIQGDSLSQFPDTPQHLSDMKRSRSQSVGDTFHRANLRESYDYEEGGMMSLDRANSFSGYKEIDDRKKRKIDFDDSYKNKVQKSEDVMDLSIGSSDHSKTNFTENEGKASSKDHSLYMETRDDYAVPVPRLNCLDEGVLKLTNYQGKDVNAEAGSYKVQETHGNCEPESSSIMQYDNSAMETLADIATKQDKLEKNTLAKSVATEYLKLATKNEYPSGNNTNIINIPKDVNELIVKPEGSKSCSICSKSFSKSSQLKLHMNIHYIERPYRCESCSVSFRSKGHLQKHERSASHHNKLTSSPAQVSSEPRPFKCLDCKIAFRIPGHLAKHLRSKMHIMKLECLAKIPFGLYAELERSNNLLTEINTVDGEQCLESLRVLAKKIFFNDPNKLNQLECPEEVDTNS